MQQCLPLFGPAIRVPLLAILPDLADMPLHALPSFYLTFIVRASPSHEIAAIPLKPSSWVFMIDPALFFPDGQRLRGIKAKVIQLWIMTFRAELGVNKPFFRKFIPAVGHVLASENSHPQHLPGCQIRLKSLMKIFPGRLTKKVSVISLHEVVNDYFLFFHDSAFVRKQSIGSMDLQHPSAKKGT